MYVFYFFYFSFFDIIIRGLDENTYDLNLTYNNDQILLRKPISIEYYFYYSDPLMRIFIRRSAITLGSG
jgi:hypothetical protein